MTQPPGSQVQVSDNDQISILQRRRGALIVFLCASIAIASLALFIDVRIQKWGWFFWEVKPEDYVWLQWLFAGLTGTALSQLWLAAVGFEKVKVIPQIKGFHLFRQKSATPKMEIDNFIQKTPTFVLNFLRGPIIVLIVLFTLTNVSLAAALIPENEDQAAAGEISSSTDSSEPEGATEETNDTAGSSDESETSTDSAANLEDTPLGIAIDLRTAHPNVLVILAFVLGYYQKLATTILDNIARKIFGQKTWDEAYSEDTTGNGDGEVVLDTDK